MRSLCTCQECGASIIWCVDDSNKMIPVEYEPKYKDIDKFDPFTIVNHFGICKRSGYVKPKIKREAIQKGKRFRGDSAWQLEQGMGKSKTGSNV